MLPAADWLACIVHGMQESWQIPALGGSSNCALGRHEYLDCLVMRLQCAGRPTCEEALADPYFEGLSQLGREPSAQPVSKLAFDFERRKLNTVEVLALWCPAYLSVLESMLASTSAVTCFLASPCWCAGCGWPACWCLGLACRADSPSHAALCNCRLMILQPHQLAGGMQEGNCLTSLPGRVMYATSAVGQPGQW